MFIDSKSNKTALQYFNAGKEQADQVHYMFPANPVFIAQVLFQLLEL